MNSSPRTRARPAPAESPLRARILAVDYGRRRLGLAVSDELGEIAQTLPVMPRTNRRMDIRRLRELVKAKKVAAIVVGFPVHLSGALSEMAQEAERFAGHLEKELRLPVTLRDERLTSWEAAETADELGIARNEPIDSVAAAILLREYLNEAHPRGGSMRGARERCEK